MVAKGERIREGMEWEAGVSRCKLLYIEWINNRIQPYDTGDHIQYAVIKHNGKQYLFKRIYIYIYIYN